MSFVRLDFLWNGNTFVPLFFAETEMIWVDQRIDFLLDKTSPDGDVLFGEELLIAVVVNFVIFDRSDRRVLVFPK